jgi:hypothetical protein
MGHDRTWTDDEDETVLAMIDAGASNEVIAVAVRRTVKAVIGRRKILDRINSSAAGVVGDPTLRALLGINSREVARAARRDSVIERPGVRIITHRIA